LLLSRPKIQMQAALLSARYAKKSFHLEPRFKAIPAKAAAAAAAAAVRSVSQVFEEDLSHFAAAAWESFVFRTRMTAASLVRCGGCGGGRSQHFKDEVRKGGGANERMCYASPHSSKDMSGEVRSLFINSNAFMSLFSHSHLF
jgi:hypothetical protein